MVSGKWLSFKEESVPSWTVFVCCWGVNWLRTSDDRFRTSNSGQRTLLSLSLQISVLSFKLLNALLQSLNKRDKPGITCMSWDFSTNQISLAKRAFQLDGFTLRLPVGLLSLHRFELNSLRWTAFNWTKEIQSAGLPVFLSLLVLECLWALFTLKVCLVERLPDKAVN